MLLKVTQEPRENCQLGLSIEVDPTRVDQELRKAARKLGGNVRIPGFRPGKAPYHVIAQQVGVENLYKEFVDEMLQEVYKAALEQENITPYASAAIEEVLLTPLTYKILVPMEPEIDLGDYRSLRIPREEPEINEADVDARLEQYREQNAGWAEVTRPGTYGDMMNINVKSVIVPSAEESNTEEVVVLDETDWDVTPDQEHPMEPPGFDEALLGLTAGETKEFTLKFPAEGQSIHAGKQVKFNVTVNHIRAYEKPALDDAFAQIIGPDYATLEDLKDSIRADLRQQAQMVADNAFAGKALDLMVERAKMTYPPAVIEDQINSSVNEFEQTLRQNGITDIDSYYQQHMNQSREQFREALRPEATKQAERNLIISELLRTESLQVTEEEFDEQIQQIIGGDNAISTDSAQQTVAILRSDAGRAILESQILQQKAIKRLLSIVRGEEVPPLAPKDEQGTEVGDQADTPTDSVDQ